MKSFDEFLIIERQPFSANKGLSIIPPSLPGTGSQYGMRVNFPRSNYFINLSALGKEAVVQEKDVILLKIGLIYNFTASEILSVYLKDGTGFANKIEGSFIIAICDRRKEKVIVITDKLNSRKIFSLIINESLYLSTKIADLPLSNLNLSFLGVASYIANGVIYNDHTLFEGVKCLPRASVNIFGSEKHQSYKYWEYNFTNEFIHEPVDSLKRKLSGLLIAGVEKRVKKAKNILLSLSGGDDSRLILGILVEVLKVKPKCFSYVLGSPPPHSDAAIAKRVAKLYKLEHRNINSYDGDIVKQILNNAIWGGGLANFCDEIKAWEELSETTDSNTDIFVGDQCFGNPEPISLSLDSLLGSLSIVNLDGLSWMSKFIHSATFSRLNKDLDDDNSQLRRGCNGRSLHDAYNFIYLDQRITHMLMPWREYFAGRCGSVHNPLLDSEILDFFSKLPLGLRVARGLYRMTAREMFPTLFKSRARFSSYAPNWKHEFFRNRELIVRELLKPYKSRLDDLIPPEFIILLLSYCGKSSSVRREIIKFLGYFPRNNFFKNMRNHLVDEESIMRNSANLLKRLLVLRVFLRVG